jgi:hypothetical protein
MTAYGEHYAAHWDVNKNPPPAFRADDGIASQRGALQDIQPIDSTEATMAQKEKPASIFTPADLSHEFLIDYEQMT